MLRVLLGESIDIIARELGTTVAEVSAWQDQFIIQGSASLKKRHHEDRDEDTKRLKEKVGELTMTVELLQ